MPTLLRQEGGQGIPSAIAGALERNPSVLFFRPGFPFPRPPHSRLLIIHFQPIASPGSAQVDLPLAQMGLDDKLLAMELLWGEISKTPEHLEGSPLAPGAASPAAEAAAAGT